MPPLPAAAASCSRYSRVAVDPGHDLLVAQLRQVEGVDEVACVQLERLAGRRDHERIVDGSSQHLRLIGGHHGPRAGRQPVGQVAQTRGRGATRLLRHRAGHAAQDLVREDEGALREGLFLLVERERGSVHRRRHARSSFATWLVRTSTASTETPNVVQTVHPSHPNASPATINAYRIPRVT